MCKRVILPGGFHHLFKRIAHTENWLYATDELISLEAKGRGARECRRGQLP
jgi:hypothetical protein